jgi:hypothetical protein
LGFGHSLAGSGAGRSKRLARQAGRIETDAVEAPQAPADHGALQEVEAEFARDVLGCAIAAMDDGEDVAGEGVRRLAEQAWLASVAYPIPRYSGASRYPNSRRRSVPKSNQSTPT